MPENTKAVMWNAKLRQLLITTRAFQERHGLIPLAMLGIQWAAFPIWYRLASVSFPSRHFSLEGRTYSLFFHRYNLTWTNERAVEVPIIADIVRTHSDKKILEVGNVLSHYFLVNHDIVDKYERGACIINEDMVEYRPFGKYDLIVSISTFEHIGWDETPREPYRVLRAIANALNCLATGGRAIVTLPLGYNPVLDRMLKDGTIPFTKVSYLERVPWQNLWVESSWPPRGETKYDHPHRGANGLVIATFEARR